MNISLGKIGVSNIKSFDNSIELDLAPITLFVGPNNSGKSTIIHALNIIKESISRDSRNNIDLHSFLNTKITTGSMRERYGNPNGFISNDKTEISKVVFGIKIPALEGDIKALIEMKQNGKKDIIISKISFYDPSENNLLFEFRLYSQYQWRNSNEYVFQINYKNTIDLLNKSDNLSKKWWTDYIDVLTNLLSKYQLEIEDLYEMTINTIESIYSKDKILELASVYTEILLEKEFTNQEKINEGIEYLRKYLSKDISIDFETDKYGRIIFSDELLIEIIEMGINYIEIFDTLFLVNEKGRLQKFHYDNIRILFLKKTGIDISKKGDTSREKRFNKRNYKEELLNRFKDDVYEFCKSELVFHNTTIVIDRDDLDTKFNSLNDIPSLYRANYIFEIEMIDNYNKKVDKNILKTLCESIQNGKNHLINASNILANKDKVFVNIFSKFAGNFIDEYDDSIHNISYIKKNIDSSIDKFFSGIIYPISDTLTIPSFDNYAFSLDLSKLEPIEALKKLHHTILIILSSDIFENQYFTIDLLMNSNYFEPLIEKKILYIKHEENEFGEYNTAVKILKLSIYSFLHEFKITKLISHESILSFDEIRISEWKDKMNHSNLTKLYNSILKEVNFENIITSLRYRSKNEGNGIFKYFSDYVNKYIIPVYIDVRSLFSNKINWFPANKTLFKRYIQLESNAREPIAKALLLHNPNYEEPRWRANKYLKALGIIGHLEADKNIELDIATLKFIQGNKSTNIMDEGHGFSQLAIMCHYFELSSIIEELNNQVLFIEEPEVSLHPSLQSKLADVFKIASKDDGIQLVIETHSEYLIRKLQYLTAKGELNKGDVAIYYFSDPKTCKDPKERVFRIDIEEDGSLSRPFGSGFYDETNNIIMDMMMLNFPDNKN